MKYAPEMRKPVSPFTRSYLRDGHPVSIENDLFIIGFPPKFEKHLGIVDNARNHKLISTKLSELGPAGLKVKFVKSELIKIE